MDNVKFWIYGMYFLALVGWSFVVLALRLFHSRVFFIVFLPFIAFAINVMGIRSNNVGVEQSPGFQGTFLSIGLIVMVSIMGWFKNMGDVTRKQFSLILLSLALALLAHVDLGIPKNYYIVYIHFRSILQTLSITLFLLVVIDYFIAEDTDLLSPPLQTSFVPDYVPGDHLKIL